jgi:alkanesulfonate monooxygenase SsuD/methylene tetrahydromethanopterin reductase-like flavin-dependent oxidoreductase (luciferase family)
MNGGVRNSLLPDGGLPEFGFVAPADGFEVRELEQLGVKSFWVGGHVASTNPSPEAIVWLARLIEQTSTAVVGTAALLLPLYPPAIVAKQLADLDRAADGRLAVAVGVGGEYESDFEAAEVPIAERGSRTDESIGLLREFWTGEPVTHDGRHHRFRNLRIHPAPLQDGGPPILVTGRQPVAMRRAARLGDGWMPYLYSPERYARSVATIRAEALAIERPLESFVWSLYLFVALDDDGDRARANAVSFLGGTYDDEFGFMIDRVACAGDPDQVAARLQGFIDAGVEHFVLAPIGPDRQAVARRLVTEIRPRLSPPDPERFSG